MNHTPRCPSSSPLPFSLLHIQAQAQREADVSATLRGQEQQNKGALLEMEGQLEAAANAAAAAAAELEAAANERAHERSKRAADRQREVEEKKLRRLVVPRS